jgi:hypothetical protein
VGDRAAKSRFARSTSTDPLTIACTGRKRIDARLIDGYPIRDSKLLPDPFVQSSRYKFTHACLPEIRPQEGKTGYCRPISLRSYCLTEGLRLADVIS